MSFVKKIATVAFSALATFTLTTFVAAQDSNSSDNQTDKSQKERRWGRGDGMRDGYGKRGGKGMRGGFGMHGLRNLDLTDAQKEQIRGIMETSKTANQPLFEEMKTLREKKRGGEELSDNDRARLKEIRSQMKQSREQTENTILGILTAEQRQKFEQQKQERQQRREEFRQRRQQNAPTSLDKNDGE